MTTLLRSLAIGTLLCGALMFGFTTEAKAGPPSTTIVNNGNHNINVVLNIQAPTINVNLPGLGGFPGGPVGPGPVCNHGPIPSWMGPSVGPGFGPTQNLIFNQGNGNFNQISNRGPGPSQTQIVNFGNQNRNFVRNRGGW